MIIDNPRPEHLPILRRIWQQSFGDSDAFLDHFFESGFAYDRCRCVFRENEPVAMVYLFDCSWQEKKVAYLYALAVEESHRKQGLSRLLLADTHAKLQQDGYAGAIMEPASPSLCGYYESLGYRRFGGRQQQLIFPGDTPVSCSQLGELGYEQARALLLPPGGVRQEGALTALLHTQASFYGGKGFVAAISRETPFIYEFLGDVEQIPGLLKYLNWEKATIRLPGGEPTSVYLSFTGESKLPGYFGLPID